MKNLKVLAIGIFSLACLASCDKGLENTDLPSDFEGPVKVLFNNHTNKKWRIGGIVCGMYGSQQIQSLNKNDDLAILKPGEKSKKVAKAKNYLQNKWNEIYDCEDPCSIPEYQISREKNNTGVYVHKSVIANKYTIINDTLVYEVNVW